MITSIAGLLARLQSIGLFDQETYDFLAAPLDDDGLLPSEPPAMPPFGADEETYIQAVSARVVWNAWVSNCNTERVEVGLLIEHNLGRAFARVQGVLDSVFRDEGRLQHLLLGAMMPLRFNTRAERMSDPGIVGAMLAETLVIMHEVDRDDAIAPEHKGRVARERFAAFCDEQRLEYGETLISVPDGINPLTGETLRDDQIITTD